MVKRVVILGRGGAGKSTLARRLAAATGLPRTELDAIFWQPGPQGPSRPDPARWAAQVTALAWQEQWIIDGDLGPHDDALAIRLRAADTVVVLDFPFWRCAWRSLRRGRERADYWRWVWSYRRHYLPGIMAAIAGNAPRADVRVLRTPAEVARFVACFPRRPALLASLFQVQDRGSPVIPRYRQRPTIPRNGPRRG